MDARAFVARFLSYRAGAGVPHSFQLHRTDDGWLHCFFLGSTPEASGQDLFVCSSPPGADGGDCAQTDSLAWRSLVELPSDFDPSAPLSIEEQLLRERMRTTSIGISAYTFDAVNCVLVVPAGGRLYVCAVPRDRLVARLRLREVGGASHTLGAKLDAQLSADARLLYFVRHSDLHVLDLAGDGGERRLTFACASPDDESVTAGVADYIQQEEFDRYTGFWPAPRVLHRADGATVYRVAYLRVDQRAVPRLRIQNPQTGDADEFFYPRAGETNATSSLHVLELVLPASAPAILVTAAAVSPSASAANALGSASVRSLRTRQPLTNVLPSLEYVPRVGWASSAASDDAASHVWAQLLDRQQAELVLVRLAVDTDFSLDADADAMDVGASPLGAIVLREHSDVWINATHVCEWLPGTDTVVWASERSGFRHLELVTMRTGHADGSARRPLTSGTWQVDGARVWLDVAAHTVYFVALAESHLRRQLYCVVWDDVADADSNTPVMCRLTDATRSHSVHVDAALGLFVATSSACSAPPRTVIFKLDATSAPVARVSHARFAQPDVNLVVPQFFEVPCDDGPLQAMVLLPQLYKKQNTYPTVVYVYGGPHVQLVKDEYGVTEMMRLQLLCALGYVVAVCDSSGSWNRGLAFEGRIRHAMGQREVADQVALVESLIARGIADRARIAVTGWSYGGYLSAMCLAQRSDVFKIAIVGAPVTQWELYDTGYTERYMDTPQRNAAGYAAGSVLTHAHSLPDEPERLVIVHGLIDENVHFAHTASLIDRLVRLGKPYTLKLFPSERHGLRTHTSSRYFHELLATHLKAHL